MVGQVGKAFFCFEKLVKYCEHPKLKIIIQNKSRYMYKPLWNFALMVTGTIHHIHSWGVIVSILPVFIIWFVIGQEPGSQKN